MSDPLYDSPLDQKTISKWGLKEIRGPIWDQEHWYSIDGYSETLALLHTGDIT